MYDLGHRVTKLLCTTCAAWHAGGPGDVKLLAFTPRENWKVIHGIWFKMCSGGAYPWSHFNGDQQYQARKVEKQNEGKPEAERKVFVPGHLEEEEWLLLHYLSLGCELCRKTFNDKQGGSVKCIDHNHETGAINGLVCLTCNAALLPLFARDYNEFVTILISGLNYKRKYI